MERKPAKNGDEPALRMRGFGWQANHLVNRRPFEMLQRCHKFQKCARSMAVTFA